MRAIRVLCALVVGAVGCSGSDVGSTTSSTVPATLVGDAGSLDAEPTSDSTKAPPALGDPNSVALPAVDQPAETLAYLEGPGGIVVAFFTAVRPMRNRTTNGCDEVAAALDQLGAPSEILAAISGTPDEATREMLLGLMASTGPQLGNCEVADPVVAAEFDWQFDLAGRRLRELGIAA